jgi:hypothetical protein
MPGLDTTLHLDMLRRWQRENSPTRRLSRALWRGRPLYGLEWGDPEVVPPLQFIKERYVLPFVNPKHTAVEIGPGGGRWTRYLLGFDTVFAVDYHQESLDQLKRGFGRRRNVRFIKNHGTDFPDIAPNSVDYIFSFGTFVHLEFELIEQYLRAMQSVAKPTANIVLQYSDKTKIMAQINQGFSDNTPERMRTAVRAAGYRIIEEDTTSLWHSSVIRFGI